MQLASEIEQQTLFTGFQADHYRFTLRVGPDLDTEEELPWGKRVKGTFTGTVMESAIKRRHDGTIAVVQVIEVDGCTLS